jgi:DNA-binding NarL/FixJ family response regulator
MNVLHSDVSAPNAVRLDAHRSIVAGQWSAGTNRNEHARIDPPCIRVLTVDGHPLFREGISRIINQAEMAVVAQAGNGREAIQLFRQYRPDVMLLDPNLADMKGVDVISAIRAEFANARIIVLTSAKGDVEIHSALAAGARGYLLKNISPLDLTHAIRKVHAGKTYISAEVAAQVAECMTDNRLTTRETEVLRQVAKGKRNRDIAEILFISEDTVKVHVKHIMEKLDANNRTQAIAIALRRGIMQL